MEKRSIRKTNYDRLNDVLYLTLNTSRGRSYADSESPIGIEILRDIETDEITGLKMIGIVQGYMLIIEWAVPYGDALTDEWFSILQSFVVNLIQVMK